MWRQQTDRYRQTRMCTDAESDVVRLRKFEVEISGRKSTTFKGVLHPRVEDHSWYRGIAVKVDANDPFRQVLIFSGWMQPWIEYEAHAPIVYTVGEIPAKTVREVIQAYTTGMSTYLNRLKSPYLK